MAENAFSKVKETRLLLIGRTGSGKSSTGNSILGEKVFQTSSYLSSSTTTTSYAERHRGERRLVVVDTPGFFDTVKSNHEIVREISKVFGYLSSGFHALLFVVSPERFTRECVNSKQLFYRTFGDDVRKYTILVLTNFDRIQEEGVSDIHEYIQQSGPEFNALYRECGKRLVMFNNKATGANMDRQVRSLLDMVDKIYRDNYGNVYSNFHFRMTRALTKIERRKRRDKKAKKKLFTEATKRLGMENAVVWDSECDRPMRVKAMDDQKGQHMVEPVRSVHKPSEKIKAIHVKPGTQTIKTTQNVGETSNTNHQTKTSKSAETFSKTTKEIDDSKEELFHQRHQVVDLSTETIEDDLFIQDLEDEADQDPCKDSDEIMEDRESVKDPSILSRLVEFLSVFIEKLVS